MVEEIEMHAIDSNADVPSVQVANVDSKAVQSSEKGPVHRLVQLPLNTIIVFFHRSLVPINCTLAANYRLHGQHAFELCVHNRNVAARHGLGEAVAIWNLASMITHPSLTSISRTLLFLTAILSRCCLFS
jgi:hypothetical protein